MIFSGVKYFISPSLPKARQDELSKFLDANGASVANVEDATHIITNTLQFAGEALSREDVRIVTDEWVSRSVLHGKQQDPMLFLADQNMIFSGVIACAADLEPCDKEVISAGINALGGLFREGYTRDCSHVLAARPGSEKYKTAMYYKDSTRVRIVLPHWFDDCFKLLTRIPEEQYEWPDPPMLKNTQKFKKTRLPEATKALVKTDLIAEKPEKEQIRALTAIQFDIWQGKRVLLSSSLNLDEGRRSAVEVSIKRAGGVPIELEDELADIDTADVFITQYREGLAFVKAIRERKMVGTLSWLFHVHGTRTLSSPRDQLLHFPYCREPIHDFTQHKITVTNYEGDARRYLKKLIELMGALFTPQMTSSNTVVVAAFIGGDKTTKAREWNIPIVNHKWLEDCFSSWTPVTLAQQQYVEFPPAINFGNLVGKRAVEPLLEEDLQDIEKANVGPVAESFDATSKTPKKSRPNEDAAELLKQQTAEKSTNGMPSRKEKTNNSSKQAKTSSSLVPKGAADTSADFPLQEGKGTLRSPNNGKKNAEASVPSKPLKTSRLKRRASIPSRHSDENLETEVQSPKKINKPGTENRTTNPASSLFEDELTDGDDLFPDDITNILRTTRKEADKSSMKADSDEEENVDPASSGKMDTPRKTKKAGVVSPQTARVMKAKVTVEIPISPKHLATLKRTESAVAASSEGPSVKSASKRGRIKRRTEESVDEEEEQPVLSTSIVRSPLKRSAAAKATMRLHEIAPDMLKFEQELRTGRVRGPWEDKKGKGKPPVQDDSNDAKKRRASSGLQDDLDDNAEPEVDKRDKKKRKVDQDRDEVTKAMKPDPDGARVVKATNTKAAKLKRQMSTTSTEERLSQQSSRGRPSVDDPGITLMTTKVSLGEDVLKDLQNLGVKITTNPSECTVLVTNSVGRTEKFLCAMATARAIITDQWAYDSAKAKKLMPLEKYTLKDPEGEEKHNIKLSESLRRAHMSNRKLLEGHSFYFTKRLQQSEKYNTYKSVIQSAGGKVMTQAPTIRILRAQKDRHLLSLPEDSSVWQVLADNGIHVYLPEIVLTGILAQKMEWGSREHRLDDNP